MNNFLLELLIEEIPARFQAEAISNFRKLLTEKLSDNGIEFAHVQSYVTPRRLIFSANLNDKIPAFVEEKKGPQTLAPQDVIEKFLKAAGVTKKECIERTIDKKTFVFAQIEHLAKDTANLLGSIVKDAILEIPWPKSMHWGTHLFSFVRPLRNILCMFDGKLVNINFDEINLKSVDYTVGHRFISPQKIFAKNIDDYLKKTRDACVIVDQASRKQIISECCKKLSGKHFAYVDVTENLLNEIAGLVEYPVVLVGKIPEKFMRLPEEVIITPMRAHQRYFPTRNSDGKLASYFVFVANNIAEDGGDIIIAGNQRVLNARLSDALFFFETDLKIPLESHLEKLKKIVFNEKLGTVFDRVTRIISICDHLCDALQEGGLNFNDGFRDILTRAALLAKCDLPTNMVCEFTELQGIMGAHYAQLQGEKAEVCEIIRDQYKSIEDISSITAALFSLADKIEIITGFFAIGKEPTGSKDPFALRRAAIGILKIIKKYDLSIDLKELIQRAFDKLCLSIENLNKKIVERVMEFILDRLKVVLKENNIQHEVINAVIFVNNDIHQIFKKAEILNEAFKVEIGEKLISIYKRAKNIIQNKQEHSIDESLLKEVNEKNLFTATDALKKSIYDLEKLNINPIEKFEKKLTICISMEKVMSNFFNNVLVNTDDEKVQQNRISLLTNLISVFDNALPEISVFCKNND